MVTQQRMLAQRYIDVRKHSERLCAVLSVEDHVPQPSVEVSPPKWHLGHTAWFFETVVLKPHLPGYRLYDPAYGFVFNSYYESQGARTERARRGDLSRPTVQQVLDYRGHVDAAMHRLLERSLEHEVIDLVELGLNHEQQHQELLLTDIKYILGTNPLAPAYGVPGPEVVDVHTEHTPEPQPRSVWLELASGPQEVGQAGSGFAFDNETPRHTVYLPPAQVRTSLVTNAEYLAFMTDGGYDRHEFWHAEGWDWVRGLELRAPLYWRRNGGSDGSWLCYALTGLNPVVPEAPVSHVNLFEAHAFCRWAGWRLPTEFEWEALAGRFSWGRRWEWTSSAYLPYPGFRPFRGDVGEYNGKFMLNQTVLRGASFATPAGHARRTYRNFFHPPLRWQYTGIRPARDA